MYSEFFRKLHIGAYCLGKNSRTDEHVRDLAECGIDLLFAVDNDRNLLDALHKYGVKAIVNGVVPGWFGADGKNAGTMHLVNAKDAYISGAERFLDHPAIVGIDIGDEPSALDFPYYGEVVKLLSNYFPDKLLYLNIYPSYGMRASAGEAQARRELGKDSYAEYLGAYCESVKLPYLSIDHYPFSSSIDLFISDLRTASDIAKRHDKPLMTVLQVNSHREDVFLSEDEIRLQAWCALAFGTRSISWACYGTGWWYGNVLDKDGKRTEQYGKLKAVNRELREIAPKYERLQHICTRLFRRGESYVTRLGTLSAVCDALVGKFESEDGLPALLIVPLHSGGEVCFSAADGVSYVTARGGEPIIAEEASDIRTNEPIFIIS